jgi:hypothetical protein
MELEIQSYQSLKDRHREIRDALPQNLSLRIHRALSWLNCAEQKEDDDSNFIFLWISFNAAYAHEIFNRWEFNERQVLSNFIQILIDSDDEKTLYNIVWNEFPNSIRLLINNQYVYQQFWDLQNNKITEEEWKILFQNSKDASNRAMGHMDTEKVLAIVFERLYTLRNQLIHGGATWNSAINRDQIRDGTKFMNQIVPAIISIMLNKNPKLIGSPCYPVVQ